MAVVVLRRRFNVDDYYRMAEAGILGADERVELLDGEVVPMSPIGRRHQACVDRLTQLFVARCQGRAVVRVQGPVRLDEYWEPEPDLSLLRPRNDFYDEGHPGPADVLLLVEVCDTSIEADRRIKLPQYARTGIAEAWLLNIEADTLEVYRQPAAGAYAERTVVRGDERVAPLAFPDLTVSVSDLLGR